MYATTPTRFRSQFTGREIDEILASVSTKLDNSYIVNSFEIGGSDKIASAELTKTLHQAQQQFNDPNYIKELITSVPNNNLFTDAHKQKLEAISDRFKGVFQNAAAREAAINTVNYSGGEITLLIDDGSLDHLNEWSVWNNATSHWDKMKFARDGSLAPILISNIALTPIIAVNTTLYNTCKALISASKGSQFFMCEVLFGFDGTNTYWTTYGEVGNFFDFFDLSMTTTSTEMRLQVNPKVTGVTIKMKKTVEM